MLYLLCGHYPGSSFSYTLYKINLQDDVSPAPHQPLFLSPILQLPGYDRFATGIRCALLDSKFYLLGGEYRTDHAYHHNPQHHWGVFHRHVYQFDISTNGPFKKMDAPPNSGKPGCCVFAAAVGGTTTVLVYHLHGQRWSRYANPCPLTMKRALYFVEAESPGHVYFLPTHQAPVKLNLDMRDSKFDVPSRGDGLVEMSITDNSMSKLVDIFRSEPYVQCKRRLLLYLGDGHFCYANYGIPHPKGPDRDGWLTYDPCARGTPSLCLRRYHMTTLTLMEIALLKAEEKNLDTLSKLRSCVLSSMS
ncbi:hypothetical protein OROGR_011785 [Orobanche gracilis]